MQNHTINNTINNTINKDINKDINKQLIEGYKNNSTMVDAGPGSKLIKNKLPSGFELDEFNIPKQVCINCSKPTHPLSFDISEEGIIYNGIDNEGNSNYNIDNGGNCNYNPFIF